ncbi:MAG: glycosyltransferase, partial [Pseudomonadota bacterium]
MSDRPEISVVIAAYNQGAWLPRCVQSVQAQTLDAIEIIIVDDCSTNDTADVIKGLASEDARIVGLTTSANAGPS